MVLKWKETDFEKHFGFKMEKLNMRESRFHAIYFIDSITGAVLVSNQYSDKSVFSEGCEDLISSFLSAINMFIKELNNDDQEEIQEINFKGSRILYEQKGRLMCIGISKKTNLQLERGILHEVLIDFYNKFEDQISHFNGIIQPEILRYRNKLENLNLDSVFKFNYNI